MDVWMVDEVREKGEVEVSTMRTKTCPQCGQELFEDMDICYGCLYDFSREPRAADIGLPEPLLEDCEELVEEGLTVSLATLLPAGEEASRHPASRTVGSSFGLFIQTGDVDLTVPLGERGVLVGRLPTNDIVLHSRAISRQHIRITPLEDGALVENLGATNPALLRGREVSDCSQMSPGDTLNVCGALLTLVGDEGNPS